MNVALDYLKALEYRMIKIEKDQLQQIEDDKRLNKRFGGKSLVMKRLFDDTKANFLKNIHKGLPVNPSKFERVPNKFRMNWDLLKKNTDNRFVRFDETKKFNKLKEYYQKRKRVPGSNNTLEKIIDYIRVNNNLDDLELINESWRGYEIVELNDEEIQN